MKKCVEIFSFAIIVVLTFSEISWFKKRLEKQARGLMLN